MTGAGSADKTRTAQLRPGRVDKATAIVQAACEVFGRDGYSRASVDTIAAQASASTRTIYNHFPGGKDELFRFIMRLSAERVRDEQLAQLRRYLDPERPPHPDDLERDLLALARAWVALITDSSDHFSLMRHIYAEAAHIPAEVLDAWQETGPRVVRREVASAMSALGDRGLIDVHGSPAQAAIHFMALISTEITQRSYWGVSPLPPEEVDQLTSAGVRAFLRAYGSAG